MNICLGIGSKRVEVAEPRARRARDSGDTCVILTPPGSGAPAMPDPSRALRRAPSRSATLNVTVTVEFTGTPEVPFAGDTAVTVGATASALAVVVKLDAVVAARALPAASLTPVVTVSV